MPSFELDNRLRTLFALVLHRAKRAHVAALFGRKTRRFDLPSINVLIPRFEAGHYRQDVLRSKTTRQPSQHDDAPASNILRYRCAIGLEETRPTRRMSFLG